MKAVLVINMPKTCTDCPCYDYIHGVCANTHKDCELRKKAKPSWCPLKPLPKKLKLRIQREWITDYDRYEIGYNACLDKITGETEWRIGK